MTKTLLLTPLLLVVAASTAHAQSAIRCSAFLHQADGSWRSFQDGAVLGPRGPIPVNTGERFGHGAGPKGEIAHALDALCLGDQ